MTQHLAPASDGSTVAGRGRAAAAAASGAPAAPPPPSTEALDALLLWCIERRGLPPAAVQPALLDADDGSGGERLGLVATADVAAGAPLLRVPGDLAVTAVDVEADPALAPLAAGRSELVALALWLCAQRGVGAGSQWAPLLAALPARTATPVLWPDALRAELLRGSPVLEEARRREAALRAEWASLAAAAADAGATLPPGLGEPAFVDAMSVVLAHAAYLPAAGCFALLPLVGAARRTGSEGGAVLDYDAASGEAVLRAARPATAGQEVCLADGRPNNELLLATGALEPANPADCLEFPAALVAADRLRAAKAEVLADAGFGPAASFPVFADRFSAQHLAYLRLARLTDPAQFARVSFAADSPLSPENEYEVLQLLMGDARERLQAYGDEYEADVKALQRRDLTAEERLAAQLRACEKRVLRGTMDGARRRLAPIRGVPTKAGRLEDPNADLAEIFETIEAIPSVPKKLFDGLAAWARGESDPDWQKRK